MPRYSLAHLGTMVKKHRGAKKLRQAAAEIGISAPTLLRVESGRTPDIETFGKICKWLKVDPGDFLGRPPQSEARSRHHSDTTISAHFKTEKLPESATLNALARMLLLVAKSEATNQPEHDA